MSESNKGIYGPDSLRIDGRKVDELPFAAAAHAKQQMGELYATEKLNREAQIRARFPTQTVDWCNAAIRECSANMHNVAQLKKTTNSQIAEYKLLIRQVRQRDQLLMPLDEEKDAEEIRRIKKQFPPYNLKAMKTQVGQFKATINRCDDVIKQERASIAEVTNLRKQCQERDRLLKELEMDCRQLKELETH